MTIEDCSKHSKKESSHCKRDCGHHDDDDDEEECDQKKVYWQLCACFVGIIILVLFIILIVWLVLRPTKPRFYLNATSVSQLNVTPSFDCVTTVMQVTIGSRNPNSRVSIFYDRVDVYASYKFQQITLPTRLPAVFQGTNDLTLWSPYLCGFNVPISPFLGNAIYQDINAGYVMIQVKINGRIRWKVGSWTSNGYHLSVNCPVVLVTQAGIPFQVQQLSACSVDV